MYNNPKQDLGGYDGQFSLDGVRAPWRIAHANAWFAKLANHSPAAQIAGKMASYWSLIIESLRKTTTVFLCKQTLLT